MKAWKILTPLIIGLIGWGCYHLGYLYGYADALTWAKGVVWD